MSSAKRPAVPVDAPTGAPALEKGLDLIEVLAEEPGGLTQKTVAERAGRSVGEIFRMLGVLERRGYVVRDADGRYALTLRLFELAHRHPPEKRLIEAALAAMEALADEVGHACHLVVTHNRRLMVLTQVQPDSVLMGWSVRVGAVFPLAERYVSARVITAFQRPDRQEALIAAMAQEPGAAAPESIRRRLAAIALAGYDCSPSAVAHGVTDVSCPVLNHLGQAVAALTVPCMSSSSAASDPTAIVEAVKVAARRISTDVGATHL